MPDPVADESTAIGASGDGPAVEHLPVEDVLLDEAQPEPAPVGGPLGEPEPTPETAAEQAAPPAAWSTPEPAPTFRVMDVVDVTMALPSPYPTVTLREAEPPYRTLVIPVGLPEGTALAHALYKVATPRPLTHELIVEILQRLNTDLAAVRLVGRFGGTYVAELDLVGVHGHEVVSCRPTDGLTLALRQAIPSPILADERLLADEGDVAQSL
jgi:uncharacterized protein